MIYFATVHWNTTRWLGLQHRYIKANTPEKHKIFIAVDEKFTMEKYGYKYDYVLKTNENRHWVKLDELASIISKQAKDDDIIIFIDGDAFPIKRHIPTIVKMMNRYPLVAIQRLEDFGSVHPHPSYCATTVGFWKKIEGTWSTLSTYRAFGKIHLHDTGGKLWRILKQGRHPWKPLHRTNKRDFHPLFFGLYHSMIYHHGGGFFGRIPRTRLDCNIKKPERQKYRKQASDYGPLFYNRIGKDPLFWLPLLRKPHCWTPTIKVQAGCPRSNG